VVVVILAVVGIQPVEIAASINHGNAPQTTANNGKLPASTGNRKK